MEKTYKPTFGGALFILGFLILSMGASVAWLNISVHITMMICTGVAIAVLMYQGYKWEDVTESIAYGGRLAMMTLMILLVIGMVMGSWIASGTVPMIIYWGLKLISPSMFLVTTCLVCSITSLATGSSWSTGATVGVALMGVGAGLGINPSMTAGAIISGAYLGDKMSPLSDTTNLAPGIAEGDLFDHIKSMLYTTTPAFIITLIIYGVIGAKYAGQQLNAESINATMTAIQNSFNMNIVVLIPPILVIVLAMKRFPGLPLLLISALVAAVIAIIFQGETVTSIASIMDSGYKSSIGVEAIDKLLSRGGLQNMAWTSLLTIIVMVYGALLERAGILEVFINKFKALTKTTGSLVCATVLSAIGVNLATASQYMSIVITGRMYVGAYKEKDMLPQTLSRTLEDAGTMTSVLVPWNACAVFFAGTLGVATISYAPFALLNWITPLIAITYGFMGKFQWKTGDIPSAKTYSKETVTENQ